MTCEGGVMPASEQIQCQRVTEVPRHGIKLAILIPAYNEGGRLDTTLELLASSLAHATSQLCFPLANVALVVVDDGSENPIRPRLDQGHANQEVWLLRHSVNLGQGAALCTATAFARDRLEANLFVTMDADGQHDPDDLPYLLNTLVEGDWDIVFGNRFAGVGSHVPRMRKLLLKAAVRFERLLSGLDLSDAHNGYRAFSERTARLIDFQQNRMAHATEIKQIVRRSRLRYVEVPVTVRYSAETLGKGQRASGSLVILRDLLGAYLFRG